MIESRPFAVSADSTELHAADYGAGKPIVVVHGGLGKAEHWQGPGEILAQHFRVVALERRVYNEAVTPKLPHAMAREAEDVRAVLAKIGEPAIVVGHSSGAVVTLEAALTHPPTLRGIVLYEPPIQYDLPLGTTPAGADAQARSEAALAAGNPGEAMKIFFSDLVGLPPQVVRYMSESPEFAGGWGEMQRLAPRQMEDNRALRSLPLSVERFRAIDVPALLLRGSESPKHLHRRLDALRNVIPHTEDAEMAGEDHTANLTSPAKLAEIIEAFARKILG